MRHVSCDIVNFFASCRAKYWSFLTKGLQWLIRNSFETCTVAHVFRKRKIRICQFETRNFFPERFRTGSTVYYVLQQYYMHLLTFRYLDTILLYAICYQTDTKHIGQVQSKTFDDVYRWTHGNRVMCQFIVPD